MSAAGILCQCGCGGLCDYTLCEDCTDGMPVSFTITLEGISISPDELIIDPQCWRFTSTSDANGTFCLTADDPDSYCERSAGVPGAAVESGGEECEFSDTPTNYVGITFSRISSTEFSLTVFAPDFSGNRFVLFYATFTAALCYLDGEVVSNSLSEGDLADDESDGYTFQGAGAWNFGYGGTATITACCP